jgi:hypothetical protein
MNSKLGFLTKFHIYKKIALNINLDEFGNLHPLKQ